MICARVILIFVCVATSLSLSPAEEINFTRDVRPILSSRCFKCHGPDVAAREADLRLDQRREAIDLAAIVPGSPEKSSLVNRILSEDPDLRMPPSGDPLSAEEIEVLRNWIQAGATYEQHWAYQQPTSALPPQISHDGWRQFNPIDNFVQARLLKEGLEPSPTAEPAVLLRRLSLDLIGLPPTIDQVLAFEQDPSEQAYEAAVDRLLESKHFGEKWAVHWLDLARYADSNGYQHDDLRTIWPYRDWVINALNNDVPFDQFTIEQLAGDLLPDPKRDQLIATGFHRNVPTNFSGGSKLNELRADVLHDRVSTTGQVWLGMTMECCQCHDHKYDPIAQSEYYALYAYFNQSVTEFAMRGPGMFRKKFIGAELPVLVSRKDASLVKQISTQIELEAAALQAAKPSALAEQAKWESEFLASGRAGTIAWQRFPTHLRRGDRFLKIPAEERTGDEKAKVEALLYYDHRYTGPYEKAIDRLKAARDKLVAPTMIMQDSQQPIPTYIFNRGDYQSPGERVKAGVPSVLHPLHPSLPPNRLGLAKWIVDPENPLTARVTVNRMWAEIFGQGIVTTVEDFGMQSAPPTHPKLLDWLAIEFIRNDWSMKRIIKTIVMSSTYRQTSAIAPAAIGRDPANQWLARGPRFRLSGELIRDNALAISGLMSENIGGPPVYPPQPNGLWREISGADVSRYPTSQGSNRYRRSLYSFLRRGNPHPMTLNFDGSNRSACVISRNRSNTPVQALHLLNAETFVESARAFAAWMEQLEGSEEEKIVQAFRRAVARKPSEAELDALVNLYHTHREWFGVAQVLLNLDEVMTKS